MNSTYAQKSSTVQKAADTKAASVLDSSAQCESLQRKADMANSAAQRAEAPRPNNTGMPDNLKAGIESLSGFSMDDVRVHYNSSKPATVQALAYTQGTDIHVAPGQEKHLPHEAWHVAQQMAGRVSPTTNINGMPVNDNATLEHEADVMGEKAVQCKGNEIKETVLKQSGNDCLQRKNVAVVVEMISPKTEINKVCGELESKRKLFQEEKKKKVTGNDNCELLFAIDFNSKQDPAFETDYANYKKALETDIGKYPIKVESFIRYDYFAKNYINAFTQGYADNPTKTKLQECNCNAGAKDDGYISYGTSSWVFGSSKARCEKALEYELGFSDLPYRGHMPFGAWRRQAHEVAKKHKKANEFKNKNYEMIYKTADSDNAWHVDELARGIDVASADEENHELSICDFFGDVQGDGVEGAASVETEAVLDTSTTKKKKRKPVGESFNPLVVTTPYMWTRGNISISDIVENPKYSYEEFLGELNGLEIIKRCRLYKKHPLNIYYPEPTTYFNSDAAECADKRKSGVLEGAAKITAIVRKLRDKRKIKDYSDAAELKKYFKFDADSPLSSDPGNRAKQLLVIYENVKGLKPKERKGKIIEMMGRGLDQSAYEPNYEKFVFDWNTKTK